MKEQLIATAVSAKQPGGADVLNRYSAQMPVIDRRTRVELIEQIKKMAPSYVPEWRFSPDDPDLGTALALMFVHLLEGNISRLNKVPYKSFLAFLNYFDTELSSARPSQAYVTFKLAEGTPQAVFVERGTRIAADAVDEAEPILFETVRPALLTPANMTDFFIVSPHQDRIVLAGENGALLDAHNGGVQLFAGGGVNMQEHTMYLRHDFLFLLSEPAFIELKLFHSRHEHAAAEAAGLLTDSNFAIWEYWGTDGWKGFDRTYSRGDVIRLLKLQNVAVYPTDCFGRSGYWIRCRLLNNADNRAGKSASALFSKVQFDKMLIKSEYAAASDRTGLAADKQYFNDIQLIDEDGFYPFGHYFAPYSLFYTASREAFSKLGSSIELCFDAELIPYRLVPEHPKPIRWKPVMRREEVDQVDTPDIVAIAELQWEYWNGRSWALLQVSVEARQLFSTVWEGQRACKIKFDCPNDIELITVNAEENYWIRARVLQITNAYSANAVYYTPHLRQLKIRYGYEQPLHAPMTMLAYNNMALQDQTVQVQMGTTPVRPFKALEGDAPALWIGFDAPPERGPIQLYAEVQHRQLLERQLPIMEWQYLRKTGMKTEWATLPAVDETTGLSRSGLIQFAGPRDFAKWSFFGKENYWVRLVNRDGKLNMEELSAAYPRLYGLQLNTTLVVQQATVRNELPDRIERPAGQHISAGVYYKLQQTPVLHAEVWVDETDTLMPGELDQLRMAGVALELIEDSEQELLRVWVKYEEAGRAGSSNQAATGQMNRSYRLDRASGILSFSEGIGTNLFPAGTDTVRVSYASGGGSRGNVMAGAISTLQSSLAFVESATNHYPAAGGCDTGTMEMAVMRGSKRLAHRNRAVTAQDFEWLAYDAHPNAAKVKCLPNTNTLLQKELGAVSIVVLPGTGAGSGVHFQELKQTIEQSLRSKVSAGLAAPGKLQVIEPAILQISIKATLWVRSMEDIVPSETLLLERLNAFLNPLTGGASGNGWEIGQRIHVSMFYALMKSVEGVIHIPQLSMEVHKIENGLCEEWHPDQLDRLPHTIVTAGEHLLKIETPQSQ